MAGGFEIDFLWFTALIFEEFRQSVDSLFRWVQGMNDAAFSHGISIQYCMDLPSYALASMEFGAVTNARASDDNFPWGEDGAPRHYRWKIAYGALLYNAVGLQPFMDVIWTQAEQPHNIANQGRYAKRTNIDLQATVAALASGKKCNAVHVRPVHVPTVHAIRTPYGAYHSNCHQRELPI